MPGDDGKIRILLVEDSFGDAELFMDGLEDSKEGEFTVHHVTSLAQGLKEIGGEYDITVTDLGLPDAKDLEAVEKLKKTRPDMPVVVLSSRSDLEACTKAIELGAQDYMVKGGADMHEHGRIIIKAIRREQLIDAARRREQSLESATGNMSDRLSGPLRSLGFLMQRLERQVKQGSSKSRAVETSEPVFEVMTKVLNRVGGFVDDMVLYAQAEAGQGADDELTTEDIVQEALAGITPIARAQGVSIETDLKDAPTLKGDRAQLVRAVAHLVDNAVRHGSKKGDTVRVAAHVGRDGQATITVDDNGPGVPADRAEDLFVFLRRREPGDDRPGSGLGLPLAARVAERHGGECTYQPGDKGARFTLTVGAARVGATADSGTAAQN